MEVSSANTEQLAHTDVFKNTGKLKIYLHSKGRLPGVHKQNYKQPKFSLWEQECTLD